MARHSSNYAQWYNEPAHIRAPQTDHMMYRMLDAHAVRIPEAQLFESITTGADQHLAFAILGEDNQIHVIHRILRYIPPLGQPPMPFDNVNLATFDDVTTLGVTTITLPDDLLSLTVPILNARTDEMCSRAAIDHPNLPQLPIPAMGPDLVELRTRKAMLIPSVLVGDILLETSAPGGLTPRDLWVHFAMPILEHPEGICAPFIEWAKAAYSGGGAADPPLNPIQFQPTPPPRHLPEPLAIQRNTLFTNDLSTAQLLHPSGDGQLLASAIGGLRADFAAREETKVLRAAVKRAAEQRPSVRWAASTARLLRLCHVQDEAGLPPVWLAMAASGVKLDRTTIQYHLSLDMPTLDPISAPGTASICSAELSKSLGQLSFQTSPDDIQAGIHVFAVCYPTQSSRFTANRLAGLYDEKVQSVIGMTMDETISFRTAQTYLLPVGYVELQLVCSGYHRFLGTILGTSHPVVTAMGDLVTGLKDDDANLHPYFDSNVARTTGILRFIQLAMYSWVKRQVSSDTAIAAPVFSNIFERIATHDWVLPPMPNPATPEKLPAAGSAAKPASASPAKRAASAPTPPSHLDSLIPVNSAFDPKAFIRAHGNPPTNDKGGAMCLLYHVRGQCKSDCERGPTQGNKSDHRRHNKSESEKLLAYLNKST